MPKNPLSIPGSWGQESETQREDDHEQSQAASVDVVPRSAAVGVVNKSGEIVDDSGKTIGNLSDTKSPQDLAGKTVTASGDVVAESGDIVAKAALDTEYTIQPAKGETKGEAKSGGWNLLGKTRSAFQTAENIRKPVSSTLEFAGNLQNMSKNQAGRTQEKPAEGAPSSAKGEMLGEKHSTDADTSRQDTSANVSEHTSVKGSDETPSSSARDQSPCIRLKDNDTPTGEKPTGEKLTDEKPTDKCHKSSVADNAPETKTAADDNVKDAKSTVDSPVEDKTPDEPMVMKSPVPIGEEDDKQIGSETKPADAATKLAPETATQETMEQVTEKGPQKTVDKSSDQTTDTVTERGRSVGAADQAPELTTDKATDKATERAPSEQPSEQVTEKVDELAPSKQASTEQWLEHATDKSTEHAHSERGLEQTTDKPTDGLGKASDRATERAPSEYPTEHTSLGRTQSKSGSVDLDSAAEAGEAAKANVEGDDPAALEGANKEDVRGEQGTTEEAGEEAKAKVEGENLGALEDTVKDGAQGEELTADAGKEAHLDKDGGELAGKVGEETKAADLNILKGARVNKAGNVVDSDGDVVGRLVEGDAKQLLGKTADESGRFLDESGNEIGRAERLPDEQSAEAEEEDQEPTVSSILKGARVNKAGNVVDSDGDVVGRLIEGDAKKLLGKTADESGNFLDESGKVIGRAEPLPEEESAEAEEEQTPIDYSILKGTKVNKAGNLVDKNGDVIGRLVEGEVKHLLGKTADESGNLWSESGKIIGRAEPLPDDERAGAKDFAPFENFPDATVEADGRVMSEGRQVGSVVEGDPKRLKGSRVDEDGDILDRRGNVVGKAEAWDEPEAEVQAEVDRSMLAGKRVNKAGNVVDSAGVIYGRVIEGNVASLVGRMCNKDGNVMSESGEIIGKAELVPEHEREGSRDGPFAELVGCTVTKDGKVVTGAGDVVGRLTSGDGKTLFGRSVDEDGDVVDRNGNVLGKAERWEEPEVEKRRDPLAGRRVNREGNIVDEDGNLIGKLVSGDLAICSGKEVDEDGDVVNSKGTTIGHVSRLEDIPAEPEPEPEVETESAEEKEAREQAEKDRKLAGQLSAAIEQSLDKIRPICKLITDKIDSAERKPKEELDEEQLVKEVKPLIEEGHRVLTETNGVIRGLDPDGRIQRNAKHRAATRDASPEEHHLAEVLKELTGTVSQTIDNAQRKIEGMPHAKKELNPLWGLLSEPLFQILAAVGLLLNGVLGLVGRLLSGLGLGGLVDKLLGGLGLNKILGSLGLGSALDALTGKKKK